VGFACCFPYSNLEGAETKMIVRFTEMVGQVASVVGIKSIAHEKAEEGLFAACRFVPLKVASFVIAGSGPEAGGLGERDADFLVADGRWMVHNNAEVGVYAENRKSEPRWTGMH
jgi:hypothetical protein